MDGFELTRALVALETPSGSEGPAIGLLEGLLRGAGYQVMRQPVSAGRDNLYAHAGRPEVVFSTHVDTVPPYVPLREDAAALHGRGSCDAKGIAAAMITAAERLRARGETRIGLLFLVGEENGSDGALAAADFGPRGRFLINGEPTENQLSVGQKGSLRVTLTANGRWAHSGYPEEGASATEALLDTVERIRRIPLAPHRDRAPPGPPRGRGAAGGRPPAAGRGAPGGRRDAPRQPGGGPGAAPPGRRAAGGAPPAGAGHGRRPQAEGHTRTHPTRV